MSGVLFLHVNGACYLNEELFGSQLFQSPECMDGFLACAKRHPEKILVSFRERLYQ